MPLVSNGFYEIGKLGVYRRWRVLIRLSDFAQMAQVSVVKFDTFSQMD